HEMARAAGVKPSIVVRGLDPIDLLGAHEVRAARGLDRDSREVARGCRASLALGVERDQSIVDDTGRTPLSHAAPRALESLAEALARDWLEEIVQRVRVECPERVLVVRRDEY